MAYHTYDFLKKRKDDPKWRDAYLARHDEYIIRKYTWILGLLIVLDCFVWLYALLS